MPLRPVGVRRPGDHRLKRLARVERLRLANRLGERLQKTREQIGEVQPGLVARDAFGRCHTAAFRIAAQLPLQ